MQRKHSTAPPSLPCLSANAFIISCVRLDAAEQKKIESSVPPQLVTVVDRLGSRSPAQLANLEPGDRIFTVQGIPASEYSADKVPVKPHPSPARDDNNNKSASSSSSSSPVVIVFRRENNKSELAGTMWRATFSCHDIGYTGRWPIERLERLVVDPANVYKDCDQIFWLWEEGLWPELLRLATIALDTKKTRNTPYLVLRAAAMLELGKDVVAAEKDADEYLEQYARSHTTNWIAIAQWCKFKTRPEQFKLHWLSASYDTCATQRVAKLLSSRFPQRPPLDALAPRSSNYGIPFPIPPSLSFEILRDVVSSSSSSSSSSAVAAADNKNKRFLSIGGQISKLRPRELLVVVFLGHYRVNGPYNDLMRSLRVVFHDHAATFAELIVVTESLAASTPQRFALFSKGEEEALSAKVPLTVLYDAQKVALDAFAGVRGVPYSIVVDSNGTIVAEGECLSGPELWDTVLSSDNPVKWGPRASSSRKAWAGESETARGETKKSSDTTTKSAAPARAAAAADAMNENPSSGDVNAPLVARQPQEDERNAQNCPCAIQ